MAEQAYGSPEINWLLKFDPFEGPIPWIETVFDTKPVSDADAPKGYSCELLKPVRARSVHRCPRCGTEFPLRHTTLGSPIRYMLDFTGICSNKKCGTLLTLPVRWRFDPTQVRPLKLAPDGWSQCKVCFWKWRFTKRCEQCPQCGQIYRGFTERKLKLKENEVEVAEFLQRYRSQRPWWRRLLNL